MKHIIKPAFSLFFIAAITTGALSLVHSLTLEPIRNQHRITMERTLAEVLPRADSFREIEAALSGNIVRIFEGTRGGDKTGYVVELASGGYSGPINVMVGISSEENNIAGMRILRHSETPGLGSNIAGANFFNRFNGLGLNQLRVVKSSPGAGEIEAITSATISTNAVVNAVNEAVEWYKRGGF